MGEELNQAVTESVNTPVEGETAPEKGEKSEKMFTQSYVNKLMKNEKESGKRAVLKELGVEDIESARDGLKKYKEYLDSQKSEHEKTQEALAQAIQARQEAEAKTVRAEACVTALSMGVNKDSLDDVITLASTKVTDSKSLDKVLEEMKGNPTYSGFFNTPQKPLGTGDFIFNRGTPAPSKTSLGEQLAKAQTDTMKNPYFTNS